MTSTGPPSSRARSSAAWGSDTVSTRANHGPARPASSAAGRARWFDDCGRDKGRSGAGEALEDAVRVLVGQDRGDDDVAAGLRKPLEQPVDRLGRVSAVANLSVGPSFEAPGQPRVDDALHGPSEERLGRLPDAAQPHGRRPGEGGELVVGKHDRLGGMATASFSAAISARVEPSTSVCSRPTFVSRTTRASTTFVASWRPPSPASTTAASTPCAAKSANAAAVSVSNCVAPTASASARTRSTAASEAGRVGLEPLVPARDVRRGVGGRRHTLPPQRRREAPRCGRLALRPDDVERVEAPLRVAEPAEQRADPLEPEPVRRPRRQRLEPANGSAELAAGTVTEVSPTDRGTGAGHRGAWHRSYAPPIASSSRR